MDSKVRIVVVDDHSLFREGIKRILEMESGFEVIGVGSNGEEALELASQLHPDIVLMDINMPKMNGVLATKRVKEISPLSRVIILSIHDDENYVYQSLSSGANGYLLKDMDSDALIEAVQVVASGEAYIHPRVTGKLIHEFRRLSSLKPNPNLPPGDGKDEAQDEHYDLLTPREKEVLQLLAEGNSNKAIGDHLYISEKTVKNHVSSILQKLNVQDRTHAVVIAIKNGWVNLR